MRCTHGVLDQVSQHLCDPNRVGADRERYRNIHAQGQPLGRCRIVESRTDIVDQLPELEGIDRDAGRARIAPGDGQEIAKLPLHRRHSVPIAPNCSSARWPNGQGRSSPRVSTEVTMLSKGERSS